MLFELIVYLIYPRNMNERRLRMTIVAEIFGAVTMGLFLVVDLFEEPKSRIEVPVGILILLLTVAAMIAVGIVGLRRPSNKK